MKRMTQWTTKGASLILDDPKTAEEARAQVVEKAALGWNLLAAYEDTGFAPGECQVLADAKAGGRLVVLPKIFRPDEQALIVEMVGEMIGDWASKRRCRICGCTDDHCCEGGCYWIEDDLCSVCGVVAD